LEHGSLPIGDDAIAVRNAYARDWIDNKAPDDVREAFNKEYKNYVVSAPQYYNVIQPDALQKDFGLARKTMLKVGTQEDPYPGGQLDIAEREVYAPSCLCYDVSSLIFL
jgi:hypothetical protein